MTVTSVGCGCSGAIDSRTWLRATQMTSRARSAGFTLGRVLLDDLGRPRDAAAAFHAACTLDPRRSIAADALAPEVEALSRAGDANEAHSAASDYLARFPDGAAARRVRRFGGIE